MMRSAIGQPPESRTSAASSRRDSRVPTKLSISGGENRSRSASNSAARPASTEDPMSTASGNSRQAIARPRFCGPEFRSRFTRSSASGSESRSSSSSASTHGAPHRVIARTRISMRLPAAEWSLAGSSRPLSTSSPASWKAKARYAATTCGASWMSSVSQAVSTPVFFRLRQHSERRVVLPNPPGAFSTVARPAVGRIRSINAGRWR